MKLDRKLVILSTKVQKQVEKTGFVAVFSTLIAVIPSHVSLENLVYFLYYCICSLQMNDSVMMQVAKRSFIVRETYLYISTDSKLLNQRG